MKSVDVLERLVEEYATVPAPPPSFELVARMDAGAIGVGDDERRGALVVPLTPRSRPRLRHLAAAMAATFVAFGGLAAAGALPDGLQREVASVLSRVGLDLPAPETPASPSAHDSDGERRTPSSGATPPGASPTDSPPADGSQGAAPPGTVPDVPSVDSGPSTATTSPSLPPELGVPPSTVQEALPPITVPDTSLPPVPVPELELPSPIPPLPPLPPIELPRF